MPGDYLEFGVWKGITFFYAMHVMQKLFPQMLFVSLDSVQEELPPRGNDVIDGYTSGFRQNEFACGERDFLNNVKLLGGDPGSVKTVPSWFDRSLAEDKAGRAGNRQGRSGVDRLRPCRTHRSGLAIFERTAEHWFSGAVR